MPRPTPPSTTTGTTPRSPRGIPSRKSVAGSPRRTWMWSTSTPTPMGSPCAGPAGTEKLLNAAPVQLQAETTDSRRPGRRLLIITYYFPPESSVGAHRWRAMSRWLRRLGHEVTVLTTPAFGRLPDDGQETQRAFDLAASPALRRLLRRPPVSSPTDGE